MSRRAPIIGGILVFLVLLLGFFLIVRPKMNEVRETQDALEQAEDEEQSLRVELARLRTLEQEAPEVRQELAVLRRQIPPVADLPGIINLLQTAATRSAVDFFSISPGEPAETAGAAAAEIPAQIQVNGGFFQVDEFLFRLETLRRAAKVLSVSVGAGTEGLPSLSVQLDVRFYTTDTDAGPGAAEADPEVAASPSPGASPSPEASPSPGA